LHAWIDWFIENTKQVLLGLSALWLARNGVSKAWKMQPNNAHEHGLKSLYQVLITVLNLLIETYFERSSTSMGTVYAGGFSLAFAVSSRFKFDQSCSRLASIFSQPEKKCGSACQEQQHDGWWASGGGHEAALRWLEVKDAREGDRDGVTVICQRCGPVSVQSLRSFEVARSGNTFILTV